MVVHLSYLNTIEERKIISLVFRLAQVLKVFERRKIKKGILLEFMKLKEDLNLSQLKFSYNKLKILMKKGKEKILTN